MYIKQILHAQKKLQMFFFGPKLNININHYPTHKVLNSSIHGMIKKINNYSAICITGYNGLKDFQVVFDNQNSSKLKL